MTGTANTDRQEPLHVLVPRERLQFLCDLFQRSGMPLTYAKQWADEMNGWLATPPPCGGEEEPLNRASVMRNAQLRAICREMAVFLRGKFFSFDGDRRAAMEMGNRALALLDTAPDADAPAVAKLQAFKDYVHERLDAMGVPVDPEFPHKAAGCRIGGRMDYVEAALASTPAAQGEAVGWVHDFEVGILQRRENNVTVGILSSDPDDLPPDAVFLYAAPAGQAVTESGARASTPGVPVERVRGVADRLRNLSRIMAGGDGTKRIDTPAWEHAAELASELDALAQEGTSNG